MKSTTYTVLHLEDSDLDAELVQDRLAKSGLPLRIERVSDRDGFLARLRAQRYDVVLSDYQVPTFQGLAALELVREIQPETPFLFVSGAMGEDLAVETLRRGATDYVLKQRMARLPAAVERALGEARERAERRAAERAARESERRLYDSLREQDRRKDEFLATLAHELRNPLAPLRNGLTLLRMGQPGGDAQIVGMMERQLGHLVHLVDDLLDVSRVTTGKIKLKPERLDLRELVAAAVETSRPLIDAAAHAVAASLPERALPLVADPTRIAQVLTNLINNAAKYTPPGGRILISAERAGRDVVVRVSDTGIGIPREMLPQVFDLFTQVGATLDRSQGGLGIGLTLVRRLVEMHGGTVTADSAGAGQGSTFTIRLPLATDAAATPEPAAGEAPSLAPPGPPPVPARRVLIVDDNVDGAESLAMMLEIAGHTTRTVHSGADAVAAAQAFLPQVVLLDIGLPGISGYEVARALRGDAALRGVVLVALTGWGSEEDKRQAREAGFDHHLTKPVEESAVRGVLTLTPGGA